MCKNQKTICIVNQYSSTPQTGMGGRHYYLARELAKLGHKVYIVASAYTHLLRHPKVFEGEILIEDVSENFHFVWVKLPKYQHAHSKQRIVNEFLFSWKLRKLTKFLNVKPDIIYHSAPTVLSYYGAKYLADFYKIPYVFEERDIWPLTLVELGGYSVHHPFIKLLQFTQDRAYRHSKFVLSNLYNAVEHLVLRGGNPEKFHWIPNGICLEEMNDKEALPQEIYDKVPKDKFIVGYVGTMGTANALDSLILAADKLRSFQDIYFVLIGGGNLKANLIELCSQKKLNNILFLDSIPKKQVQSALELFDVCFIGSKFSILYRFGASPNKIPEYLYAAKPIIYTIPDKDNAVKQAQAGICIEPENLEQITQAILELYQYDETKRIKMGENGKRFVLENLEYKILAKKLSKIFFN